MKKMIVGLIGIFLLSAGLSPKAAEANSGVQTIISSVDLPQVTKTPPMLSKNLTHIMQVFNEVAPKEIVTTHENVEITLGESLTLSASVLPENTTDKELFWIADDESILYVDDYGTITGLKPGTTKVQILSVTDFGEIEKFVTVTVTEDEIAPKEIVTTHENVLITLGESLTLTASVLPENATDKELFWIADDESILYVDDYGTITGLKSGTTNVQILSVTDFGEIEKFVTVTVTEDDIAPKEIVTTYENVEITLGESLTLSASVLPENATDKELFWIADDESILYVDDYGTITGLKTGTTNVQILSVTDFGEIEKFVTVTVTEDDIAPKEIVTTRGKVEINLGESLTLIASVLPENATDKELFWLADNESILYVDDYGTITGLKPGTTNVRILSVTDFGEIEKFVTVIVKKGTPTIANFALPPLNVSNK